MFSRFRGKGIIVVRIIGPWSECKCILHKHTRRIRLNTRGFGRGPDLENSDQDSEEEKLNPPPQPETLPKVYKAFERFEKKSP